VHPLNISMDEEIVSYSTAFFFKLGEVMQATDKRFAFCETAGANDIISISAIFANFRRKMAFFLKTNCFDLVFFKNSSIFNKRTPLFSE
jgi:hypothetical protein